MHLTVLLEGKLQSSTYKALKPFQDTAVVSFFFLTTAETYTDLVCAITCVCLRTDYDLVSQQVFPMSRHGIKTAS